MLGEKEEGQSHNAIELDQGAQHNEKSCRRIALLLNKEERQKNDSGYGNIELLHVKSSKQFVGTEPQNEYLLIIGKERMPNSLIKE